MTKVYFIPIKERKNFIKNIENGLIKAGIKEILSNRKFTAVKMHFGEKGNTAYIKPVFINHICSIIEENGGKPFLTDTNTLYRGERSNSVNHIKNALFNGFSQYPIIIADGLRGESYESVKIDGELLKEVYIGSDIHYADALISVAHFKGHELSGFGGAIKNIGMGCASRKGKLIMHSNVKPYIDDKCVKCMQCIPWCQEAAIEKKKDKVFIDSEKCTGCGLCIEICNLGAIRIKWDISANDMQKKMAEYALGVHKKKASIYVNFVMDITPVCDCYPYSDNVIAQDIGILISVDPVAVDKASYDLVNKSVGKNILEEIHSNISPLVQLQHAEKIGLGLTEYTLKRV